MKKKAIGRLGVLALALTLISTCLMGGTLAKYTADVTGSATATVAKFSFDLNGVTEKTEIKTIDLSTLFSKTYNSNNVSASSAVVAPGTSGKVKIELTNKGEVAIKPDFTITETNTNKIPLQYAITATEAARQRSKTGKRRPIWPRRRQRLWWAPMPKLSTSIGDGIPAAQTPQIPRWAARPRWPRQNWRSSAL